jgi:hypothetical protein
MTVIGIGLSKMEAKKLEDITGAVRVNSGMNVTDVKEISLPAFKTKGLSIEFEYRTKYVGDKNNKNMAEINIDGNVIIVGEDQEKILKEWKKDKSLADDIRFEVIRVVSDKCSKKAILLSDDLQIPPPPLMLPQAFKQEKEEKK